MPRTTDPTVIAALQSNLVRPVLLVQVSFTGGTHYVGVSAGQQIIKLATTNGNIVADYIGVGSLLNVSMVEEGLDVQARGCQIELSGLSPQILSLVTQYSQVLLPVRIFLALLDTSNSVIWQTPIFCGRTDQPTATIAGDKATVQMNCESQLLEMNVSVERRYTNEDQQIEHPGDNGFRYVDSIQEVAIYWGRTPSSKNNR